MREVTSPGEKAEAWNTRLKPGLGLEMHSNQSKKMTSRTQQICRLSEGRSGDLRGKSPVLTQSEKHRTVREQHINTRRMNSTSTHPEWTAHQHTQNGSTRRRGVRKEKEEILKETMAGDMANFKKEKPHLHTQKAHRIPSTMNAKIFTARHISVKC